MFRNILLSFLTCFAPAAMAADTTNLAKPWQLGFGEPASPVMEKLDWLHTHFLLYIIVGITVFVLLLTLFIIVRFNARANPVPSKTTHNTMLEVVWTVIPVLILVAIAIPSLRTYFFMEHAPQAEMTLKVVGRQWYWSYEYPDYGNVAFDSYMVKDEDLKQGDIRLLTVDNTVVVPVDTVVHVQITGADVIHAWAIPEFGVKKDAIPGRLNQTWFKATRTGRFYGQCSELCGVGHGFMPIVVDVVSKQEFDSWLRGKQKEAGVPVTGAVITTSATDAVPAQEKAVPPKSVQEPKPGNNAPQAPATPEAAKPADEEKAVEGEQQ